MAANLSAGACSAVADLLTADALDILEDGERLAVRRHLSGCLGCSWEVDDLRLVAAQLGEAVASISPPSEMKEQVLAAALRARPPGPLGAPLPVRMRQVARGAKTGWLAAAAALVIAGGTVMWARSLESQVASLETRANRYDRVVGVLASERLTIRSLESDSADLRARGTMYVDPESRSGMIMVRELPPLPPGRSWQLWYVRGSERMSGGMLRTDTAGSGYTLIRSPSDLENWESVGITEEPAGGSPAPTSPRIIGTRL